VLLRFLRLLLQHSSDNLTTPLLLARVFAPVLMGSDGRSQKALDAFLLQLLCADRPPPMRTIAKGLVATPTGDFELI
jgi:hypothetical protein